MNDPENKTGWEYSGFMANSYDICWPDLTPSELSFYKSLLEQNKGPSLEIGCGTGRLLLRLIRSGLHVDGLDLSESMLAICREKAKNLNIEVNLFHQDMLSPKFPGKYNNIYVPYSTFLSVTDPGMALKCLENFHHHLHDDGMLAISVFVPSYEKTFRQQGQFQQLKRVRYREGSAEQEICISHAATNEFVKQIKHCSHRYEIFENDTLIKTIQCNFSQRWYFSHELQLMLCLAGFQKIKVFGDYTFEELNDKHSRMILVANK